jgi:hypothetical protein
LSDADTDGCDLPSLASATYRIAEPNRYPIWRLIATKTVAKAIISISLGAAIATPMAKMQMRPSDGRRTNSTVFRGIR